MSFISFPHEFDHKTGAPRAYQIATQRDGVMEPIGFMRADETLPCDLRKLAENFAAMLNGQNPVYRLGESHIMFYEKHSGGFNFRFKERDSEGVTEIGALFTLMPGIEMEFDDAH